MMTSRPWGMVSNKVTSFYVYVFLEKISRAGPVVNHEREADDVQGGRSHRQLLARVHAFG